MTFHIDTTEESDDYFVDQVINQIPTDQNQDPLNLLLHAEEEYIEHGKHMVDIYNQNKETS